MTAPLQRRQCLARLGGLLVAGLGLGGPALARTDIQRATRALMGTKVDIVAQGADTVTMARAIEAAFAEMQRLERLMSHYRSDSLVAALHRRAGQGAVDIPAEMRAVLHRASALSLLSDGAFDITVGAYDGWSFSDAKARIPSDADLRQARRLVDFRDVHLLGHQARLARPGMRIDLGGVAKLPILQAGLQVLEQHGLRNVMINGGGDVLTRGQLDGRDWRVGIRDPRQPDRLIGTVHLSEGCVVSSGDYERGFVHNGRRYHHVLDPTTGLPTQGVRGVVMVTRHPDTVNGLGASIMAAGAAAGHTLLEALPEVDGLIVDGRHAIRTTGRMAENLA